MIDYASTTPDPVTLQNLVDKFAENQVEVLAMEVSSHALTQGRINGMSFTTAIFTNLTQDHLDYHGTMENYFQAKRQLFYWQGLRYAIINADDEYGMRLLKDLEQDNLPLELISYGVHNGILRASDIQLSLAGMSFKLSLKEKTQIINVPVIGKFNVYNLLAVFATLLSNGASWEQLPSIANALQPVVGRMDADIITGKPLVVVDYSHTPDSLEKALTTLQEIPHQKLICVFGCGGNRDKAKRPIMGQIANLYADEVIITTDNPRDEDPDVIIQEIIAGISADNNYHVISDRKDAIATAIKMANHDDIILVAGKGHEDYQEIKGIKHPFSDLEIVHGLLVVKE
ncbi:MAG: UDP-N-acetylmuramoyl-L-alanyl-D-glutamate--2,6-diaminopimelate ligase [Proteobacteria bacterium]|nr:MAG: UDP-N-acetylmuramoyl-L-alanyl-D-glutamate--2,6-diaminopimelate ligase [Pseudomonadota bacterium]